MVFRGKCPLFAPHLQVNFRNLFWSAGQYCFPLLLNLLPPWGRTE